VKARPARIFLAAELLLGAAYLLLPDSLLRAAVYCALGLGMVVATCCWWRWRCGCGGPAGAAPRPPGCSPGHLTIDSAPGNGTTVDVEMANRPVGRRRRALGRKAKAPAARTAWYPPEWSGHPH
jgi:hypothetical protein